MPGASAGFLIVLFGMRVARRSSLLQAPGWTSLAISRRRNFWILPVLVLGNSANTTWRGHLKLARWLRHQAMI